MESALQGHLQGLPPQGCQPAGGGIGPGQHRGHSQSQGDDMSQCISAQRLWGGEEPAATAVVGTGAQVQQGLDPSQARRACTMPSFHHGALGRGGIRGGKGDILR